MTKILLVDDNRALLDGMAATMSDEGYTVSLAASAEEALDRIEKHKFATVVSDLKLPKKTGIDLLREWKERFPQTPFIIITAYGSVETAVEAMKLGAFDFVTKPFAADELSLKVRNAVEQFQLKSQVQTLATQTEVLREEVAQRFNPDDMIGVSPQLQEIRRNIAQIAASRSAVLILGETGTGKELVARAIHAQSTRASKPFVSVNCAVFSENLLESELFGHEKGAFTGADKQRIGRFELAHTGTIFLDEVGELSAAAQAKLLRVLQEQEFERVGGAEPIRVDIRLVAATNRNLTEEIRMGRFREDLYYRLSVVPIQLPPLRERRDDIAPLIAHFVARYARENHKQIRGFSSLAVARIMSYDWPGNVRELENVVERGVVLATTPEISESALPFQTTVDLASSGSLTELVDAYERELVTNALRTANGNATRAARALGLSRSTLRYKIEKYDLYKLV